MDGKKHMTKKLQHLVEAYEHATMRDLYDLYERPSCAKIEADRKIRHEMIDAGGYGYRIIGGNSSTFSCAYKVGTTLIYHTAYNKYIIEQ